jgi:hypothetical protein
MTILAGINCNTGGDINQHHTLVAFILGKSLFD